MLKQPQKKNYDSSEQPFLYHKNSEDSPGNKKKS